MNRIGMFLVTALILSACGQQDASVSLSGGPQNVAAVSAAAPASGNRTIPVSGDYIMIHAPSSGGALPYAKFHLVLSGRDSNLVAKYGIKLDGQIISETILGNSSTFYMDKEIPVITCMGAHDVAQGQHTIEVFVQDNLGNILSDSVQFTLGG